MQQFRNNLSAEDRLTVRRWRLVSAGIYGSIVAALILYVSFQQNRDISYAAVRPAAPAEHIGVPPR